MLLFMDGCDQYSSDVDLASTGKWDHADIGDLNWGATDGRFGGGAISCFDDTFDLFKNIPLSGTAPSTDELFVSFAFKPSVLQNETFVLFQGPNLSNQMSITLATDGAIHARLGGVTGGIIDSAPAATIAIDTWYWIEVRAVLDNTVGLVEVKVDEVQVISASAVDTQTDADSGTTMIYFSGPTSNNWYFDDVVIHNSSGAEPTGFLGDSQIETKVPTGAGDSSDGTPSGAATNWEAVDDAGASDGDTTHVALAAAMDEDLYGVAALTQNPDAVHAIAVNVVGRTDSSRPIAYRPKVKHGSTEGNGDIQPVPANSANHIGLQSFFEQNPDTAAAWAASEISAMQIGMERLDWVDPYWDNVHFLLGFDDDADADTSTTDEGPAGTVITFSGGSVEVDDAQFKFGGKSIVFSANSYLSVPKTDEVSVANDVDVTMECWFRTTDNTQQQGLFNGRDTGSAEEFYMAISSASNKLSFVTFISGSSDVSLTGTTVVTEDEWHHAAACREGDTWYLFLDGVLENSGAESANPTANSGALHIGNSAFNSGRWMRGWIDEIRWTTGVARYTSAFTPPTAKFPRR